jgi:DNA invertase Pin-like site-specific DNA recombinase
MASEEKGATMQTAFGYIRVSTDGQATDGVSLDAQRDRITAWCLGNGFTLNQVFVDAGLSGGRSDNRPGLQSALDAVCKVHGVLVVYSLSRLARSTKDTIQIGERLDKSTADLVSLSEKIDTTSAAGKMMFRMLAVLAEFERDQISERTSTAMKFKAAQGQRVGKVPFGFDLAGDAVTLVPNAIEQESIAIIHELRKEGKTLRAIAAALNQRQIPTKEGKPWTHSTIQRILSRAA